MSNTKKIDLFQFKSNSSSTNSMARSKKIPPPPLSLPLLNSAADEDKIQDSYHQNTQKYCSFSSSKKCAHENVPFVLPTRQRDQILQTLINSSSTLLVPPSSETKQRKNQTSLNPNQTNLFKQQQPSKQGTVTDAEWIEFIRLIVQKPLENDLKMLLDKYKTTFFDRVNAPNITDSTIRTTLCDMVSETLSTYSTSSIIVDDTPSNVSSSIQTTTVNNDHTLKRKRKTTNIHTSKSSTVSLNNQTKFVISYIIPGNTNSNKIIQQQRLKQFHKKYTHLFKYIPDKDEETYLIREGHLNNLSQTSSRSSNNQTNNICLMLYDEVIDSMDDYDVQLSGISLDDSFTLPDLILVHIHSSIQ